MEQLLATLISFPSVTEEKTASSQALDYIERYLEERGMFTRRFESNGFSSLVATIKPNHKTPTVMLTGHIDVVPGKENQFTLAKKDGKYFGRGVFDMKFAIAAYLQLVDTLKDYLEEYDFGILITSDEEIGGADGMKMLVAEGYRPKVGIVPDGGDNWQIQDFSKGINLVKLTASGMEVHSSQPWKGNNAIHKLLRALPKIQALVPTQPTAKDPFKTSLSINMIEGGRAINQTPEHASCVIDIRLGSMADYQEIYPAIRKICHEDDITAELTIDFPPTINVPTDPYIKQFRDIMIDVIGRDPGPSPRFATTDARFLNAVDVPCVIVSPDGGGCHEDEEWISAEGLEQFYRILQNYLTQVARTQRSQPPLAKTA